MAAHEELLELSGGFGFYQLYALVLFFVSLIIYYGNETVMVFGSWIPQNWPSNDTACGALLNGSVVVSGCPEGQVQFYSLVIEWGLVGASEYIPALLVSIQLAGSGVGPLIFGQLSDNYGRKPIFIASFVPMVLFGLGSAFCRHWQTFAVMRFFIGVFTSAACGVTYICLQECFLPRHRLIYTLTSWPLAGIVVALLAMISRDWRYLSLAIQAPAIIFLASFGITESPKWLLQCGKFEEAKAAYIHIASINRQIDKSRTAIEDHFLKLCALNEHMSEDGVAKRRYKIWDIFYSRKALPSVIVILLGWVVMYLVFYGLFYNISDLSGDIYLNVIYVMISTGIFKSSQPLVDHIFPRLGRKGFLLISLIGMIITVGFSTAVTFTDLPHKYPYALTIPSIVGLGIFEISWTIVILQTIELFPTEVRNMAFNAGLAIGGVASIISPQIFLLHHVWPPGPYMILLVALTVWTILSYGFLPETKGAPLPDIHELDVLPLDTINEAETERP